MIKKYRQMKRIIEILKKGLGVETLDDVEKIVTDFYIDKGIDLIEKN